jgi:hypothetical protein
MIYGMALQSISQFFAQSLSALPIHVLGAAFLQLLKANYNPKGSAA